jgi:DNA-binding NtrC family response regulator
VNQSLFGIPRETDFDDPDGEVGFGVLFRPEALKHGGAIRKVEEPSETPWCGTELLGGKGLNFLEEGKWGIGHSHTDLSSTLGGELVKIQLLGGFVFLERRMALERILIVDDELVIRRTLESYFRSKRYSVSAVSSLAEAQKLLARDNFDLLMLDMKLPDGDGQTLLEHLSTAENRPMVVMITGNSSVQSVVDCMRAGAFDYVAKPFSISQIELVVKKAAEYQRVVKVADFLIQETVGERELIGRSPAMNRLRELIQKVARTDATVLIHGENGTGKELVANEIYRHSRRGKKPFIKVNCAAISESLIESEFFGHEKGAFTGATERRDGRFELADGGTILLDEVSEITPGLQGKLLRVLQEREFERVGGNKTIKVDVRVIACTNRDLVKAVSKGEFREDLYYRLNVFPLHVPPLRERLDDVPELATRFLEGFNRKHGLANQGFTEAALAQMQTHSWPGNVRELQNLVERAAILSDPGHPIGPETLGLGSFAGHASGFVSVQAEQIEGKGSGVVTPPADGVLPLHEIEKRCIFDALEKTGGNRTQAAALLEISIRTLRNKLLEYRTDGSADPAEPVGTAEEA